MATNLTKISALIYPGLVIEESPDSDTLVLNYNNDQFSLDRKLFCNYTILTVLELVGIFYEKGSQTALLAVKVLESKQSPLYKALNSQ